MLQCGDCLKIFGAEDTATEVEVMEYWGTKVPRYYTACPYCGGSDLYEVEKCAVCGEYTPSDELLGGVCDSCLCKYEDDTEAVFEAGEADKQAVKLNGLIAESFTADEIGRAMLECLKQTPIKENDCCRKYVKEDRDFFAEQVAEMAERKRK